MTDEIAALIPLFLIAGVMLISGALGGLANYFTADTDTEKPLNAWQHVFVGIVAAFIVPLLLNLASGDLIDKIRGAAAGSKPDYSKLFVLAGFCLVAAASSRAFIRSVSQRVLDSAREAAREAQQAREDAFAARAAVEPLIEAPEAIGGGGQRGMMGDADQELSLDQQKVMEAMIQSRFTVRSISGITSETGLPIDAALAAVDGLCVAGRLRKWPGLGVSLNGGYLTRR
ncbi:YEATS-associated helix-containing protein [Roseateles sp. DC23W]|uniref:YEATS-associated helix-containing protein n=1 Tax=Pelomonas dachongensis TaxID=3299029 RepID=A0ABW7EV73_9BURK